MKRNNWKYILRGRYKPQDYEYWIYLSVFCLLIALVAQIYKFLFL